MDDIVLGGLLRWAMNSPNPNKCDVDLVEGILGRRVYEVRLEGDEILVKFPNCGSMRQRVSDKDLP